MQERTSILKQVQGLYIYLPMCVYIYRYMCVYMYVYTYIAGEREIMCVRVCVCVCMCVCTHIELLLQSIQTLQHSIV